MTIAKTVDPEIAKYADRGQDGKRIRFPEPPERLPEDMTSFKHLAATGSAYRLIDHFGSPETTIVTGELYTAQVPIAEMSDLRGLRYPDLMIAFNADIEAFERSNAYVISEQGKPPDFVLEVVSRSSRRRDFVDKRIAYAALGIPEYWRFDDTDHPRRTKLAGDRLSEGEYHPIPIQRLPDSVWQGYSPTLNLRLRWEQRQLHWHDPATGRPIATLAEERARADQEREARVYAETRARGEHEARIQAEAHARELEAELRRLRGQ